MAALAAAVGTVPQLAAAQTKNKLKITSVVTRLENDYFTNWNKGATEAAAAIGVDYKILAYDGQAAKHIEIVEAQLQAGTKGLFGDSNDTANVKQITSLAGKYNATYIAVWDTLPWMHPIDQGNGYGSFFAADDVQNAYNLAKTLFEAMGSKGNFVHITGFPGASPDISRTLGVDRALKEFPNIKLLARQPGNWNPVDSRRVMEDMLTRYPKIDGVYAQNDSEGLGIVQALKEAGLKIPVVGHDGNAENLELIEQGQYLASISYIPQYQAGFALVRAFDVLNGWKPSPTELMMATGGTLVTKANVAKIKAFLGGGKLPFDWRKMSRVLSPDDWDPQNFVWPLDVEQMWAPYPRPAGYELPKAYRDAVAAGDLQRYKDLYFSHYKKRIPT
ncbi:sugar ABC transporter substrate-binding protein [Pararobbsia silviterrae]|uniref:Sugar ABC transporter substrate-binding protein n=2 Tax=Pararobbsia silviterrae TaxID=1792498 RepID=A0A494XXH8_9BURK|nr:sugar ABC transporter substrate-binding protein [Pararobbsia silviterrae]